MIADDDITEQLPVVADDRLLEAGDQAASIRIIADNLLPGVAPCHHVIDGTLKSDTAKPTSLDARRTDCPAETKNKVSLHREAKTPRSQSRHREAEV